jgi:hypothetical protein
MQESRKHMIIWVDVISIIVAVLALIVAILNYNKYKTLTIQYNAMVNTQTLTAQGALETQIRSAISEVTHDIVTLAVEIERNPESKILQFAYSAIEESYRNAYEDACGKYLDGKIDKERFEKMFQREIRQLVEEEPHKKYYAELQTPYASTVAVYKQWNSKA